MKDLALLATKENEDIPVIKALVETGFDLYLFNGWHQEDNKETDLRETICSLMPRIIFSDDDLNESIIDTALEIHNDERTRHLQIVFLTKRTSVIPDYYRKFRPGEVDIRTRPYGIGELPAIIERIRQRWV